ncbi:MAG: ferritin [Chloroflexi bacterium]|nr:ferritin [Chloroflexota bacterium]MDL1883641.1 ferritin [Anaerolineae bacterium CFX8]
MLSEKMQAALNAQINMEFFASYQYLAMAAYFESENLMGFANWMHMQSQEENMHAMKFYNYINDRRGRVTLQALDMPKTAWSSPLEAFEDALKHEQKVTAKINALVDLAIQESDHATNSFLKWFVDEQVEEEANVDAVIQDLKRIGSASQGLFMLDRELAQRGPEEEAE